MNDGVLFPTSIIGSMPRPSFVKELIAEDSPHAPEDYERLMGSAIHYVVALQEAAGLDVLSDGEWWRKSYIGVIAELAHGFELSTNPTDGRPWTIVVEELSPKQPGFIAKEIAFLKKLTNRQLKATLPAPTLLGERMWDPEQSLRAYPTRDDFVRACVPILRRECVPSARDLYHPESHGCVPGRDLAAHGCVRGHQRLGTLRGPRQWQTFPRPTPRGHGSTLTVKGAPCGQGPRPASVPRGRGETAALPVASGAAPDTACLLRGYRAERSLPDLLHAARSDDRGTQ